MMVEDVAGTATRATIRLHDFAGSSAAYRVRIGLALKGVPYERVHRNLRRHEQRAPDYLVLNPQGLVPALEIDGLVLTQSLAILSYLQARHPNPAFLPDDPAGCARVMAMALTIACDIQPLNNVRVLRYLGKVLRQDAAEVDRWYAHWVIEGFQALEQLALGAGRYLSGDLPGLADICLVPQMFNSRRLMVPLDDFPTLVRIDAALTELPAFAAAHPDAVAVPG